MSKKSLIAIKPFGVELPEDCIDNCWSNHSAIFGVIYWDKIHRQLQKKDFSTLHTLKEWSKTLTKNDYAIMHFGGRYPIVGAAMPYSSHEGSTYAHYFHAGDLEVINTVGTGNEDLTLWESLLQPISIPGMFTLVEHLSKNPKNGQFLIYSNYQEPWERRFGEGWIEDGGMVYSNSEYKKKVWQTQSQVSSSSRSQLPAHYQKKEEKEETAEAIDFFGITLVPALQGISRYFKLEKSVARVESSTNPDFKPMDFIMSIGGHEFEYRHLSEFVRKKKSKGYCRTHIEIMRPDMIAYSRREPDAKKEIRIDFEWTVKRGKVIEAEVGLTDAQKNYILVQLVNTMFPQADETFRKTKRLKFAESSDDCLMELAEENNVNGWKAIKN